MAEEAEDRIDKAGFVHDVTAPDTLHAAFSQGGVAPVHGKPYRFRADAVGRGVDAGVMQGVKLVVHGRDAGAERGGSQGGEAEAAAEIEAGSACDFVPAFAEPGAQGYA